MGSCSNTYFLCWYVYFGIILWDYIKCNFTLWNDYCYWILVDDGIIIAENIYQRYEKGEDRITAAINGTLEVLPAVFSAILTTIVAFSLFFMLDGMLGDFFPEMGFVVIGTLIFSLIEGVLILPTHIAHSKALKGIQPSKSLSK